MKFRFLVIMLIFSLGISGQEKNQKAVPVINLNSKLGEGSLWDYKHNRLLWIDIEGKKLHFFDPVSKTNKTVNLPLRPGTVVPRDNGSVVVALEDGLYNYDPQLDSLTFLMVPKEKKSSNRFNDGKCDPQGRFWVGTMSLKGEKNVANLYQINPDYSYKIRIKEVSISNGIVWSPDGTKMYYIDTPTGKVVEYQFDQATGEISSPRDAIIVPDSLGHPDGSTMDAEGKIWIALWGGGAVTRWDPETGELLQKIEVGAKNVTSCAFGGKKLDTLYITTSGSGVKPEESDIYPDPGALFMAKPGVKGLKASYFNPE